MHVMRKHPLPFEVSAPIIDSMGQQLQRQMQPQWDMQTIPRISRSRPR
jgi:hypothetical protein